MPLFDYLCKSCEAKNEVLIRGSEEPVCPSCGSKKLVKQASAFAAVTAPGSSGASCADSSGTPPCVSGGCCPCH